MQLADDPEAKRIHEEMQRKLELRRLQLLKQQERDEREKKRQELLRQQAEETADDVETPSQPIVNVGIIETVSRV